MRYSPDRACAFCFTRVYQVDFASTLLDTPGEFISIWSEVTTLTWSEVQSATPVFATMGSILALAIVCAGLGWRFDQKVRFEKRNAHTTLASTHTRVRGVVRSEKLKIQNTKIRKSHNTFASLVRDFGRN